MICELGEPIGLREADSVIPVKLVPAQAGNGNLSSSSFPTFSIGHPGGLAFGGIPTDYCEEDRRVRWIPATNTQV